MNKKGQESGKLENILLSLLIMTAVATLSLGYLQGISTNYNVPLNESQYTVFNKLGEVNETLSELTAQFINDEGEQTEDSDIITTMITGAYGLIKLLFNIPDIFVSIISNGLQAVGVPPAASATISWLVLGYLVIRILFAAVELVMKVRA